MTHFSANTYHFLHQLELHNDRAWFEAHKQDYENDVRKPALDLIEAMQHRLPVFAPHFRAEPKKVGGSLIRIYRDTRFSKNKVPYKTNIGIQFRHEAGKDIHAPGFYVHIATDGCFIGLGCWSPDPVVLGKIRTRIFDKTALWNRTKSETPTDFDWMGEKLRNAPRGFPSDHEAVEDLKRKSFVIRCPLTIAQTMREDFVDQIEGHFKAGVPFMRFLCTAIDIPY